MDLDYIRERFREMPDEELENEISQNGKDYTGEALDIAKAELENRNFLKPKKVAKKFVQVKNRDFNNLRVAKGYLIVVLVFISLALDAMKYYYGYFKYQQKWLDTSAGIVTVLVLYIVVVLIITRDKNK